MIAMAATLVVASLLGAVKMEARPAESVTVKIPFVFTAGNHVLPAGTYKIEMLTKGQPGVDEVEVIALRGVDTHSYTTIVTRLGKSEAKAPVMSFSQLGDMAMLAEVRASGRSFALKLAETDYAIHQTGARFDMVSERNSAPVSATIGQE
jgi:hypothetical protein